MEAKNTSKTDLDPDIINENFPNISNDLIYSNADKTLTNMSHKNVSYFWDSYLISCDRDVEIM